MGDRQDHDFYETPDGNTRALLDSIGFLLTPGTRIFEPCVGDGAIPSVVNRYLPDLAWTTNDIDPSRSADTHEDAFAAATWQPGPKAPACDWVITNPPFRGALVMLEHALRYASVGIAFHVRISFWEPTIERGTFWDRTQKPTRQIILPRRRFDPRKRGTDSATTMWLIWVNEEHAGWRISPFVVWSRSQDREAEAWKVRAQ